MTMPDQATEIAAPDDTGRQWVQLLPLGRITARDGRRFALSDPGHVLAMFRRRKIDLPVDYEHAIDTAGKRSDGVPAAGWITDLEQRPDGIWGHVRWTEKAAAMIRSREYRYLSPSMAVSKASGEIMALRGAGLVHHPAFHLTALASEEPMPDTDNTNTLARIVGALDLDEGTDADTIVAAIAALKTPDPRKFVPVEAVADLMRDRNAQIATASEAEADRRVEVALADGYITPAMRPWAVALCRSDLNSFEEFLEKTAPPYAHLKRRVVPARAPSGDSPAHDAQTVQIARNIGVDPAALTRR